MWPQMVLQLFTLVLGQVRQLRAEGEITQREMDDILNRANAADDAWDARIAAIRDRLENQQ